MIYFALENVRTMIHEQTDRKLSNVAYAKILGIDPKQLRRILKKEQKSVSFRMMDALWCYCFANGVSITYNDMFDVDAGNDGDGDATAQETKKPSNNS